VEKIPINAPFFTFVDGVFSRAVTHNARHARNMAVTRQFFCAVYLAWQTLSILFEYIIMVIFNSRPRHARHYW